MSVSQPFQRPFAKGRQDAIAPSVCDFGRSVIVLPSAFIHIVANRVRAFDRTAGVHSGGLRTAAPCSNRPATFRWFTHGCAVLQPTGYFQASRWDAAGNQFHLAIAHDAFLIELQRLLWRCAGQLPQSVRLASLRLSIGPQASIPVVYARLRRAPTDRLLSGIPLRSITTLRCKRGLSVSQWNRADFSVEPATVLHSAICRVVGAKHLSP
jgi:hypothetical protein